MQPELLPECGKCMCITDIQLVTDSPRTRQQSSVMQIQLVDMRLGLMLLKLNKGIEASFVCLQQRQGLVMPPSGLAWRHRCCTQPTTRFRLMAEVVPKLPADGEVCTLKTCYALLKRPVVSIAVSYKHTLQSVLSIALSCRYVHSRAHSKGSMQKCSSTWSGLVTSHLCICSGHPTALQSLQTERDLYN